MDQRGGRPPAPTSVRRARPGDPRTPPSRADEELTGLELVRGAKVGSQHYRWRRTTSPFKRVGKGQYEVGEEHLKPRSRWARLKARVKHLLIGVPLATENLIHERLSKIKALAVFSSDAISSSAYATEEILLALVLAGAAANTEALPIAMAIAALLCVVVFSYRQTIKAYPKGGGSYIVAKENLGVLPSLTAGSALMVDYILTVSVSIAAGTAALIAAVPEIEGARVEIAIGLVALMTIANLRGIRESGSIFAAPTYFFILTFGGMILVGIIKLAMGSFDGASLSHSAPPREAVEAAQGLTLFLILRAFASGATALTGVEAISDGVPAFKPDEPKNASITLLWMAGILATLFVGVTFLTVRLGILPSEGETVVSQVGKMVFGDNPLYYLLQATTVMILVLAANTAFADFPRLASFISRDRYLPHQLSFRGERLAFSNGIILLGVFAALLLLVFRGDTHRLIPLYAVGVFLSFTISQSGMVMHWRRLRTAGWRRSMAINAVGATATGIVLVIVAATKFTHGAWLVLVVLPVLIVLFKRTHRHYANVAAELELGPGDLGQRPQIGKVVIPVGGIDRATVETARYAQSLSEDVTAVHVVDTELDDPEELLEQWEKVLPDVKLVTIDSGIRAFTEPFLTYLDEVESRSPERPITVVLPEFVTKHFWQRFLHNQTSRRLRKTLLEREHTVVVNVPQHLRR